MIKGVLRAGAIQLLDPVPSDWPDGQEVAIEPVWGEPSDDPGDIDRWYEELTALGFAHYEPGEREQVYALLAEADDQAKELVRREMGLP